MKLRFSKYVSVLYMAAMALLSVGCHEDRLIEEENNFTLSYGELAITNTVESNGKRLAAPEWTGRTPSAFEITRVSVDGKAYQGEAFEIVRDNGAIEVADATALESVGDYSISVACMSGGQRFEVADAAVIKVLASVAEAIVVEPAELSFDVSDIGGDDVPTTAQVKTNDGRDITSVRIASVERYGEAGYNSSLFTVSGSGVVAPVDVEGFPDGDFVISLIVTIGDEEGIVPDALTMHISSRPTAVRYEALDAYQVGPGETETFVSSVPVLSGSEDGVEYQLDNDKLTSPDGKAAAGMFSVDAATGAITVTTTENTVPGEYFIGVKVRNRWTGEDFVTVEGGLAVHVSEYAYPITTFSYPTRSRVLSTSNDDVTFSNAAPETDGGQVTYSLVEDMLPASLKTRVTVDAGTGLVTLAGGASGLKAGVYAVLVHADNSTTPGGKDALFYFTVYEEGRFTYFSYGNNYEDIDAKFAAGTTSQFRYTENGTFSLDVMLSDIPDGADVTWAAEGKLAASNVSVDNSGRLTFTSTFANANQIAVIFVSATYNGNTVTCPVFFNCPQQLSAAKVTVSYTPFVLRFSPSQAGPIVSSQPYYEESGSWMSDFRANFTYYNINGKYSDGTAMQSGVMANNQNMDNPIKYLWLQTDNPPKSSNQCNFGAKAGMSVVGNANTTTSVAAYIDQTTQCIVVNPDRWKVVPFVKTVGTKEYTNTLSGDFDGVFCCNSVYGADLGGGNGYRATTYAIWIDQDYIPLNQE